MRRLITSLLILVMLATSGTLLAAPPLSFLVRYDAGYGKFKAQSARSLEYQADQQLYVLRAETRLTLLGGTLSSIEEYSAMRWIDDQPVPFEYRFEQKGLGSRQRSVSFDQQEATLAWVVDDQQGTLAMDEPVFDDLSSFMALRQQLIAGNTGLYFAVVDKSEIKPYHYEVVGTETLQTAVGTFETVHIERIREPGNARTTEFWLAPALDYMLLKLRQSEPDGRDIKLDVREIE